MILGNRLSVLTKKITPTKLKFHLTSNLTQPLYLTQSSANAVEVDWGDGSVTEQSSSLAASFSHTYAEAGDYDVRVTCADGESWSPGMSSGSDDYSLLGKATGSKAGTFPNLQEAYFGDNVNFTKNYGLAKCTGLTYVDTGNYVSTISENVFSDDTALVTVNIGENVSSISATAFTNCNRIAYNTLGSVKYLGSVSEDYVAIIGVASNQITSCNIPWTVTVSAENAFDGCTALTKVVSPNIKSWCHINFTNDKANPTYYAKNLDIADTVNKNEITFNVQDNIDVIKSYAFINCTSIQTIIFNTCNIEIQPSAFQGCESLHKIVVPSLNEWCNVVIPSRACSPFQVGESPTTGESLYTDLYVGNNKVTSLSGLSDSMSTIPTYMFCGCHSLITAVLPRSVYNIEMGAFSDCTELQQIDFSNIVSDTPQTIELGAYSFSYCYSLSSIVFPSKQNKTHISKILGYSFVASLQLKSVSIPYTVGSILDQAFASSGLENLVIGDSTNNSNLFLISDLAFAYCYSLRSITIYSTHPPMCTSSAFSNVPADCAIYVPSDAVNSYKTADGWSTRASYIQAIPS